MPKLYNHQHTCFTTCLQIPPAQLLPVSPPLSGTRALKLYEVQWHTLQVKAISVVSYVCLVMCQSGSIYLILLHPLMLFEEQLSFLKKWSNFGYNRVNRGFSISWLLQPCWKGALMVSKVGELLLSKKLPKKSEYALTVTCSRPTGFWLVGYAQCAIALLYLKAKSSHSSRIEWLLHPIELTDHFKIL